MRRHSITLPSLNGVHVRSIAAASRLFGRLKKNLNYSLICLRTKLQSQTYNRKIKLPRQKIARVKLKYPAPAALPRKWKFLLAIVRRSCRSKMESPMSLATHGICFVLIRQLIDGDFARFNFLGFRKGHCDDSLVNFRGDFRRVDCRIQFERAAIISKSAFT